MMTWTRTRAILLFVTALGALVLTTKPGEAHNPITSKYTYNDDIFPIMRDRCGRCHVPDGVAPMSLVTYKDAFPWAESLRAELIAGHMPPWNAEDGAIKFKNAPAVTPAEIDKILTWATGRTPQGNPDQVLPSVAIQRDWPLGKPDLVLPLPAATLAADASDSVQEFTVPTGTTETNWIRAVDLLPATPAIVRNAVISIKAEDEKPASIVPERVLAIWVPGEDPIPLNDAAFQLAAGAQLVVRVHYLKTYANDGKAMTDRSSVGLYFAPGRLREVQRMAISSTPVSSPNPAALSFGETVDQDVQALAFNPDPSLSNVALQLDTVSPTGVRTTVIKMAARPNWARRYWFDQPLALSRGTKIEVKAVLNGDDPLLPPTGTPLPPQPLNGSPIRVVLDVVSSGN